MIGDRGVAVQRRVEPDLVRAGGLAMELQTELLKPLDDVSIAEAGERAI